MAIPQHTIDQILDRTDLIEVIGKYIKLKKSGRSYSGCCPFHQEKTPSFHVYRDKQYYHCFGCQANGNAIRFLMEIEGRSFLDVMKDLSSQTGIELPQNNFDKSKISYKRNHQTNTPPQSQSVETPTFSIEDPLLQPIEQNDNEGNLYDLLEMVTQFYQQQLQQAPQAQSYFKKRGLTQATINEWRLGYAPEGWQHLEQAFPKDIDGLKKVGLIRTSDSNKDFNLLRDRVIFPIRDKKGRVVGFGGRALNDEIKPKYINSPDSDIFHKNQLLYGLYEGGKQKAKNWLMVEGYMDVIALHQNGIHGAVATLGTASNADHLIQLFKYNSRITLAFDGDQAGQKAARRTLEIALPLLEDGRELQFFVLPEEHDPDSLIKQNGVEHFNQLWQQAPLLSDFLFSLLSQNYDISTPEGKSLVMGNLRPLTHLLPKHGSFRALLTQFFKEKLGLTWRFQTRANQDANISFQIQNRLEDNAIALIIQYPSLYRHFETLRALLPDSELLTKILAIFHQLYEHLPEENPDQSLYILGACHPYHSEINKLMQYIPEQLFLKSAEKVDYFAQDFALHLQIKYLKIKIEQAKSLKEAHNLRLQLNEINKQVVNLQQKI